MTVCPLSFTTFVGRGASFLNINQPPASKIPNTTTKIVTKTFDNLLYGFFIPISLLSNFDSQLQNTPTAIDSKYHSQLVLNFVINVFIHKLLFSSILVLF